MNKGILTYLLLLVTSLTVFAQSADDLAGEYYKNGDFEKAALEYSKQIRKGAAWQTLFRYVNSLKRVNKSDEALKFLKKQGKADEDNKLYYDVLTGYLLKDQPDTTKSYSAFAAAFADAKNSGDRLARLGEVLKEVDEPRWAIKSYETARMVSKEESAHSEELAALYRSTGSTEKYIEEMLNVLQQGEKKEVVYNSLQSVVNSKDEALLEKVVYEKIQKNPNVLAYNEVLSWYLLQKQRFSRALVQEKAMDRRMKMNGSRVYDLGQMALNSKDYKTAADAFEYIVTTYPQGQLYPIARRMVINAREEQVKYTYPVDKSEIHKLIGDYQKMLREIGLNPRTLEALRNTANLYAYYLDEKDSALTALNTAIEMGRADKNFVDKCKIDKGDIYLLMGEPWESTLLYSQVEKSQKEELLGYEAKLKNAKLHYYKGEFVLAKELLDILKMATSREIANDAESLSLLIVDNTGLDSTEAAMREYAAIDLMLFQNKTDQAIAELNKMQVTYKDHSLVDEIIWLRANTYLKQGRYDEAIDDLKKIIAGYSQDILGDDALFLYATIMEERKKDKPAAMALYQKLLQEYPGSIHVADARKRFRILRGDIIN
ncbi:tetratricopeptide repeat protein [Nibrella viscosa]|uniref:Tetratricopeptide repeat protein n=1 Tax=Nibrella viscosa TaxID=1084524 RepID=A0ABP8KNJ1_9BACT